MAANKLNKLEASKRKRLGYLQKYNLPAHSDIVMMQLEKAIKQERIKSHRRQRPQQLQLDIGV